MGKPRGLRAAHFDKPWVREKLDAAIVKRISGGTRLIPVVIDECVVPLALQSTAWERIPNPSNYEAELGRIVMAIYGHHDKPPLGEPPVYARTIVDQVPGLTKADSLVLKLACESVMEAKVRTVDVASVWEQARELEVPEDAFYDSLEILEGRGYLKMVTPIRRDARPIVLTMSIWGFEEYAQTCVPEYDSIVLAVVAELVNANTLARRSADIAEKLNQPLFVVNHVLELLGERDLATIRMPQPPSIGAYVVGVSPELKRMLG
jgi:hypothetical protein